MDAYYALQTAAIETLTRFHTIYSEFLDDIKAAVLDETGSPHHFVIRNAEEAAQAILGDPTRLITPSLVLVMDDAGAIGPLTRRAVRNYLIKAHHWASVALDEPPTYTLI